MMYKKIIFLLLISAYGLTNLNAQNYQLGLLVEKPDGTSEIRVPDNINNEIELDLCTASLPILKPILLDSSGNPLPNGTVTYDNVYVQHKYNENLVPQGTICNDFVIEKGLRNFNHTPIGNGFDFQEFKFPPHFVLPCRSYIMDMNNFSFTMFTEYSTGIYTNIKINVNFKVNLYTNSGPINHRYTATGSNTTDELTSNNGNPLDVTVKYLNCRVPTLRDIPHAYHNYNIYNNQYNFGYSSLRVGFFNIYKKNGANWSLITDFDYEIHQGEIYKIYPKNQDPSTNANPICDLSSFEPLLYRINLQSIASSGGFSNPQPTGLASAIKICELDNAPNEDYTFSIEGTFPDTYDMNNSSNAVNPNFSFSYINRTIATDDPNPILIYLGKTGNRYNFKFNKQEFFNGVQTTSSILDSQSGSYFPYGGIYFRFKNNNYDDTGNKIDVCLTNIPLKIYIERKYKKKPLANYLYYEDVNYPLTDFTNGTDIDNDGNSENEFSLSSIYEIFKQKYLSGNYYSSVAANPNPSAFNFVMKEAEGNATVFINDKTGVTVAGFSEYTNGFMQNWYNDIISTTNTETCANSRVFYFDIYSNCGAGETTLFVEDVPFRVNATDLKKPILQYGIYRYCSTDSTPTVIDLLQGNNPNVVSSAYNELKVFTQEFGGQELNDTTNLLPNTDYYIGEYGNFENGRYCGTYNLTGNHSSKRVKVSVIEDCFPVCQTPINLQASPTDTSVYLSWEDDDASQEPVGGWEITYALSTYDPNNDTMPNSIITYEPEITIEDLIPSNAYDFWVRSICSFENSEWVLIHVDTPCTNCNSFTPQIGKEYVIGAWVKENWDTKPVITMNPPVNKIKEMLNDLVSLYNTNNNTDNLICPNGTEITAVTTMTTGGLFHEELIQTIDNIDGQSAPAIYNFQYYTKENKSEFRFQFTKGEHHWSDNLLTNPGAELGTIGWSSSIYNVISSIAAGGKCGAGNPNRKDGNTGNRFFWMGVDCEHDYGPKIMLNQDVDVSEYLIDNGDSTVEISGYMKGHDNENGGDIQQIQLVFKDSSGELIGITDPYADGMQNKVAVSGIQPQVWYKYMHEYAIPPRTRTIRVKLIGINRTPNLENDSFFDDLSLRVNYPTFDDLSPVQSFDVDCYINGTYEHSSVTNVTDVDHYPFSNNYYDLEYSCNTNTIENKYKYGKNVYTSTEIPQSIYQEVYTYNNTYLELVFLNNQDEIIPDFTGALNRRYYPSGNIIDEWQRIQGVFKVPVGTVKVKIALVNKHISDAYFDDVRVFPKDGNMKSFVYDQITQKLMAELDENNYATFYEYDNEGGLIRVKKETEKGIFTIQETRSGNVKK